MAKKLKRQYHYDCYELEEELKSIGWAGDLVKVLNPISNCCLCVVNLDENDWEDYEDDYVDLAKHIIKLGITKEIWIHTWW